MGILTADELAELVNRLADAPIRTVHLTVFGVGASRPGADWFLSLVAMDWKVDDHLQDGRLELLKPMTREAIHELQRQMPYKQDFEVRARMQEPTDEVGLFVELVGPSNELTAPERPPLSFEDDGLGLSVAYDYDLESWRGTAGWCGREVELSLDGDTDGPGEAVAVARRILGTKSSQQEWKRAAKDFAAKWLLDLQTDEWREEGKKPLTARGFKTKLKLQSLVASASGEVTFWFSDGGMFSGHSVRVKGHVESGLAEAEI